MTRGRKQSAGGLSSTTPNNLDTPGSGRCPYSNGQQRFWPPCSGGEPHVQDTSIAPQRLIARIGQRLPSLAMAIGFALGRAQSAQVGPGCLQQLEPPIGRPIHVEQPTNQVQAYSTIWSWIRIRSWPGFSPRSRGHRWNVTPTGCVDRFGCDTRSRRTASARGLRHGRRDPVPLGSPRTEHPLRTQPG